MSGERTYRVVQWTTGNVGVRSALAVLANPEYDLVGCYAWGPDKVGRDVGELIGTDPTGVIATNDVDALLALQPDCVVYNPKWPDVDELVRILESGVNVTATAGFITGHALGEGRQRIIDACERGGSSIFGSGMNPGLANLLGIVSAGLCDRIDSVRVLESVDSTGYDSPDTERSVGHGRPIDDPELPGMVARGTAVFGDAVYLMGDALGVTFVYGRRSLFDDFATRAKVYREESGSKSARQKALDSLKKYLDPENKDKPYRAREDADFTHIKDRLYRPAQQVIKCVAQYHGITDVETRTQVHKLKAMGKLSTQVFGFLDDYLDAVARLRIANHLKWGREYEIVYFKKPAKPSAEEAELIERGTFPVAAGAALRQVKQLMADSETIRALGTEFHRQMSKTGLLASKTNPLLTANPRAFAA